MDAYLDHVGTAHKVAIVVFPLDNCISIANERLTNCMKVVIDIGEKKVLKKGNLQSPY